MKSVGFREGISNSNAEAVWAIESGNPIRYTHLDITYQIFKIKIYQILLLDVNPAIISYKNRILYGKRMKPVTNSSSNICSVFVSTDITVLSNF